MLGNVLFALMSDSTTTAMYSIIDSSSLIKKILYREADFPDREGAFSIGEFLHLAYRSGDCNGCYARYSEA